MTNHLLLFTIGPVQSFIAQARKTQDLYAGSQLLSELIDFALTQLNPKEIIFPAENIESKPNRFLAIIDEDQIEIAKKLAEKVKEEFKKTADKQFNDICNGKPKPNNFDDQIDNFLDINWVILPYDEKGYQAQYKEIEKTLGAIKNVRVFNQLEEQGRKCSLCGERNVLFYHPTKGKNGSDKKPAHIQDDAISIKDNKLTSGEGLCAVCFTKRFYKNENFPSTAEIALMDTLKKLDSNLLNQYKDLFKGYTFDEQLYFDENLSETYFKKNALEGLEDKLPEIKKKNEEIKKATKDKDLKLNKYYAIIALDGDNMGKWLSGDNINNPEKELLDFHKNLSEKLGTYAGNVKTFIKQDDGSGKLVYAGGDDVLAFVNLNHLTEVLKALRKNFEKEVNQSEEIKKYRKDKENLTVSCGVAIAHYKIPLGEVLKRARKMEKAAKEKGDRNAFGLAVLKHSGEIEETVFKWNFELPDKCKLYPDCNGVNSICLLGELIDHLKQEEFSNTFIKSLNTELYKLMDEEGKIGNLKADDIIDTELKRLLIRSRNESKGITKDKAIELAGKIFKLYESKNDDVQNFLSFLNIADFLHREVNK
jgi:CRISPR-associated protein Cmr2